MVFQNRNSNTPSSGGGGFLKESQGALLTPSAGVITPTDPIHHVAAGTISSIATTNLDPNIVQPLTLIADGAIIITLGATIVGRTTALATNDTIWYVLDGGTVWREVAVIRALAAGDIPNLDASKIASGLLAAARMPALTGDATTVAGAVATTLATVNGNVGSFGTASQVPALTVNAKGLVTAAANTPIAIASSALTDLVAWTTFTPVRAASTGTWTVGTIATARYMKIGKMLTVLLEVNASSVSATPSTLSITIPGSFVAANTVTEALTVSDNGTARTGSKFVLAGGTSILMTVAPFRTGTWATAVTATDVSFSFTFEVQ